MAAIHNAIRRYASLLKAYASAFGLDQDSGVERLGETITPVVDLWALPELHYLAGWRNGILSFSTNGVVAEYTYAAILNPTGSGYLVKVRGMWVSVAATYYVRRMTEAQITGTLTQVPAGPYTKDTRWPKPAGGTAETVATIWGGTDASAVLGSRVDQLTLAAATTGEPAGIKDFILSPGWGLAIVPQVANQTLGATIVWWERVALKDELP